MNGRQLLGTAMVALNVCTWVLSHVEQRSYPIKL